MGVESEDGALKDVKDQFDVTPPAAEPYTFELESSGFDKTKADNLLVLLTYTGELQMGS